MEYKRADEEGDEETKETKEAKKQGMAKGYEGLSL